MTRSIIFTVVVMAGSLMSGGPKPAAQTSPETSLEVLATHPELLRINGILTLTDKTVTGTVVSKNADGSTTKTPYINGRRQGVERSFYADGTKKSERVWHHGKRDGGFSSWWPDGNPKKRYVYSNDLAQGEAFEWFVNRQKARSFTYLSGKEEGSQVMWYEDGTIRANYFVKDGRRYGSIGTKGCPEVDNV